MNKLLRYNEFNQYDESCFLIIDNSKPPKHKYLHNVLKYFDQNQLPYKVVESVEELLEAVNSNKILGAISTGSDFRVSDIETNELNFKALEFLDCPIYGICFGFQSMAKYYGSEIGGGEEFKGNFKLDSYNQNENLFNNVDLSNLNLSFCFHDFPINAPNGFNSICQIDDKIAGISNGFNRWGTLFHPENSIESYSILDNFISICKLFR